MSLALRITGPTTATMPRQMRTMTQLMPNRPPRVPTPTPCSIAASGFCSFEVGCHFGCGASSGNAIGGRPFSALSIGISVIATTSEMPIASATVSAWSRNSWPAMPCTNTSGRNTAIVVKVDATTAMLTSRVPVMAASRMPSPRSRAFAIDSSTTIESSTTRPVASARPPSDITLRLRPSWSMKKNVAMIDTGSDRPTTNVLQPSRRNRKMIRIASAPPITASIFTSLIAWRMKSDWSSMVVSSMSGGICSRISFSSRLDRIGGGDRVRVAFLVDRQLDGLLAGQADDRLAFLVALAHLGDVLQPHRHAAGRTALRRRRALHRGGGRHRAGVAARCRHARHLLRPHSPPRRHPRSAW